MNRLAFVPLVPVLVVIGLSACGGDDAPSKQEFANQAEEICQNAEKQLESVGENVSSPSEIAAAIDKVIDQSQSSLDDLRELERPEGADGEDAEKFVNALESDIEDKGIPALEDLRDALKDNDQQAAQEAAEKLQAIETSNTDQLAKKIGATDCGE
jgi:formate dehydrogenase maturation protein FdhE